MTHEEKAREIALWLYGPDEGMSEGLVRTLIDKITEALAAAEKKGREEGYILAVRTAELKRRVEELEQRMFVKLNALCGKLVGALKDCVCFIRPIDSPSGRTTLEIALEALAEAERMMK